MPVETFERHVTFVDTYWSEARATLVGVTSLVAVAAEHVAGRRCVLSVTVITDDVAQTSERRAAVRTDEVIHVPTQLFSFDTFIAEDNLHHHHHHHHLY